MATEQDMQLAQANYETLCSALDHKGWHYERDDANLTIRSGVRGDDLAVEFIVRVRPEQQLVTFLSMLPFKMAEAKRTEGAVAVCVANYGMINGSFDYDISDGSIIFRLNSSYRDSVLGEGLIDYMVVVSAQTVDNYNDRFLMLSMGAMTLEQFIAKEHES